MTQGLIKRNFRGRQIMHGLINPNSWQIINYLCSLQCTTHSGKAGNQESYTEKLSYLYYLLPYNHDLIYHPKHQCELKEYKNISK